MYCLDTNIAIDIFRGDESLRKKIEKIQDFDVVFITPITLCELYKGVYLYHKPEEKIGDVNLFVANYQVLDFDLESCKEFGKIYADLNKEGKAIPESDLMIASITKTNDLILVTRDKKHFENTGVKIEVW